MPGAYSAPSLWSNPVSFQEGLDLRPFAAPQPGTTPASTGPMILRLIALAILVFFAYRLLRRALAKLLAPEPDVPPISESQSVVPCKSCGTFVPKDRARTDDAGHFYCSDRCREDAKQRG